MDVVLAVSAPGGEPVAEVDVTARDPEPLSFTTDVAGPYGLEAPPSQRQAGRYAVTLRRVEPRAATPEGRVNRMMWGYEEGARPLPCLALPPPSALPR